MFHEYQLFILLLGSALSDYFTGNDVLKPKMFKAHHRGHGGMQRKIIYYLKISLRPLQLTMFCHKASKNQVTLRQVHFYFQYH